MPYEGLSKSEMSCTGICLVAYIVSVLVVLQSCHGVYIIVLYVL